MTGQDLMFKDDVQRLVRNAYEALDTPSGSGTSFYTDEQLSSLPAGARDWALGVGNPVPHARLCGGEAVLDLGCGAGIDTILAAREIAPDGRAVGLDLLPPMTRRAAKHADEVGVTNATFLEGEMEAVPLPDAAVDVVISNGAINLSARKSRVIAEAFRVLRPGGRLCVSDLTVHEEALPVEVLVHPSAWAG